MRLLAGLSPKGETEQADLVMTQSIIPNLQKTFSKLYQTDVPVILYKRHWQGRDLEFHLIDFVFYDLSHHYIKPCRFARYDESARSIGVDVFIRL